MATTISNGGVYSVLSTDTNIYVRTAFPVTIVAEAFPALDRTFRVFFPSLPASVMVSFTPNQLYKIGSVYMFGGGLDSIAFTWDGTFWNSH